METFQMFLEVFMDTKKNIGKYCRQKNPSRMCMDTLMHKQTVIRQGIVCPHWSGVLVGFFFLTWGRFRGCHFPSSKSGCTLILYQARLERTESRWYNVTAVRDEANTSERRVRKPFCLHHARTLLSPRPHYNQHMGSMATNAFTQQAQNDLVQNLENVQVENDIFVFLAHQGVFI